jgi:TRAP-type mannitol/chloroaromatic compound transport system permease small subunit
LPISGFLPVRPPPADGSGKHNRLHDPAVKGVRKMAVLKLLMRVINKFNEYVAKAFSFLIFLLIVTLTYEVIARYGFGKPTQWSFDATYFISSLVLVFGLAYTWQINGHVSVDLITIKLPPRVNAALKVFFILSLFFVCWLNIFRVMIPHLQSSWALQERSMTGFMPPIYPYKTWIFAGVIMLVLQGIVEMIKQLHVLITGDEPR